MGLAAFFYAKRGLCVKKRAGFTQRAQRISRKGIYKLCGSLHEKTEVHAKDFTQRTQRGRVIQIQFFVLFRCLTHLRP